MGDSGIYWDQASGNIAVDNSTAVAGGSLYLTHNTGGVKAMGGGGAAMLRAVTTVSGTALTDGFVFQLDTDDVTGRVHNYENGNLVLATNNATVLTLAPGGNASFVGDAIGDGGDQFYGFLQNQVASTTTTLTAAQCGSTIVSDSADVVTLPEASTVLGCRYTFVCGTSDDFDVNPNDGTDQILPFGGLLLAVTPSAGDAIRGTDTGASIVLEAVGANAWAVIGDENGTWSDVN